jgi:hypothetical protein
MSTPNDGPIAPPGEAPAAEAPASAVVPPATSPYRVPEPPAQSVELAEMPAFRGPRARPIAGPALALFAVLLWSFVVAGQLTTSWMSGGPLPQSFAIALVVIATFAAWIGAVRRSRHVAPPRSAVRLVGRAIAIGLLAFGLWCFAIFVAILLGGTSRDRDFLIALFLVVLATVAAILGPRWAGPTPESTHRARFARTTAWVFGTILTLVAGAELAING